MGTMESKPTGVELFTLLDQIRDETLDLDAMGRRMAELLEARLGFVEVHLLHRDIESGDLINPSEDRPMSDEMQRALDQGDRDGWAAVSSDTMLFHPLMPRDKDLGLLALRAFDAPNASTLELVELAVAVIDSALEHALAFDVLKAKNVELEAIYALDHLRDLQLPFDEMIDRAAQEILRFISADSSALVLFEEASGLVDIRFPSDRECDRFTGQDCLKALRDLAFRAFKLKGMASAQNIHPEVGSAICMPLILEEAIIGAFVVIRAEVGRPFSARERKLLSATASQIDTAIFEDLQRQQIKNVFNRYVSHEVVEEMLKTGNDFMEGQRRDLTVLFSDLRGFTSASERLDTDIIVRMLNEHLSAMTEVVLAHRGTLDKFIGDCVMAFWGAPVEQPEHAWQAVQAAVAMRAAHEELLKVWAKRGLEPVHLGIGINTGEMFVGNIGDQRKSSYTVIGDHVNLAARLEGVARGREIIITDRTYKPIQDRIEVQKMEPVRVKGKKDPIAIYNVIRIKP